MKSNTAALLISASREFLGYYARMLKSEDFEIIKARGYHDWSEKRHLFQFDVCLIDNESGEFDFETFFDYISRYNPHAVVLSFGHEPPARRAVTTTYTMGLPVRFLRTLLSAISVKVSAGPGPAPNLPQC